MLLLLTTARAGSQESAGAPDLNDLLEAGADWVGQVCQEELPADFVLPSPEEWQQFWNLFSGLLDQGSPEDFAALTPSVELALRLLGSSEMDGAGELADWLRQRVDYFELASAAVARVPEPEPPPKPVPPPPAPARPAIVPPSAKPAPRPPAQVEERRQALLHSQALWRRKVGSRPAPPNAAALVPRLKKAFRAEGVPAELVWIAEVESSLNPKARSPRGAAGLFQFMPATAREYGLRALPFDERKNPDKSARAAARYLKDLHGRFGSWPLALAGYNAGGSRVQALLDRHKAKSFDAIASRLPAETQMYVPKVLAVIAVREGKDPAALPPPA